MDIDGTFGWADWIRFALLVATWGFTFWLGREYQRERESDE